MCVGIFELALHGREAESLQAVKDHISRLEDTLTHTFQRITTPSSPTTSSGVDPLYWPAKEHSVSSNSVILLKTGASVLFDRLPMQLLQAQSALQLWHSGGSKKPAFLVYSDAPAQLGPFTIRNALANVSTHLQANPKFSSLYTELHRLIGEHRAEHFEHGWELDKFKFLPMWSDAFSRHPTADWYIGYEADTYVLWPSLFRFLSTQDASKEQLFGCASILIANQELFANGGCPYVISGALMRATYGKDDQFAQRFDDDVLHGCCGDAELSIALRKSATVPLKGLGDAGPRFNNDRPEEVLFEEGNWCTPVLNFHHVSSQEVAWLAEVEHGIRGNSSHGTVLYSDVFEYVIPPELKVALEAVETRRNASEVQKDPMKKNWEAFSGSDHRVKQVGRTNDAEGCKKQCFEKERCTSWVWSKNEEQDAEGECHTMHDGVRVGKEYRGAGTRISGWSAKGVASFKARYACKDPPAA